MNACSFLQAEISGIYGIDSENDLVDCYERMCRINDLVIEVFECLAYLTEACEAMEDARVALESAFSGSWDEPSYDQIIEGIEVRAEVLADSFAMTVEAELTALREERR